MTQDRQSIRFLPCGDTSFSMEFGTQMDRRINARVIGLYKKVQHDSPAGVREMIPTFRSLLVIFDPAEIRPEDLQEQLLSMLEDVETDHAPGRRWALPVCYEGEFAPDLDDVAKDTGLSADEVRDLHTGRDYFVYMIGFLPGFGYMGDLAEAIQLPRRTNPRTHVPLGSVAIAKDMTAVYSLESPGGWHLLGRTPVPLFNPAWEKPVLLAPGDSVGFEPVSASDYAAIERDIAAGTFDIQPEIPA